MDNRQRFQSSMAAMPFAAETQASGRPLPVTLPPLQHGVVVGTTWGAVALFGGLLLIIWRVVSYEAQVTAETVAALFLVAAIVTAVIFLLAYQKRDKWFREQAFQAHPLPAPAHWPESAPSPAARNRTSPVTAVQARRQDRTIGRIVFPADLELTEDKILRLAVSVANETAVWSRRGLADPDIVKEEKYPLFCQTLLQRGFLALREKGKGVVITNDGREWFVAVAREAGLLPYPEEDEVG